MGTFPIPRPISLLPFTVPTGQPTYTDIYNETVGKLSVQQDSLEATLLEMAGLSAGLEAEVLADNSGPDFPSLSDGISSFDPTSLDGHVSDFVASQPDSQAHIDALAGAYPDILRELPMDATFDGGIGSAPSESTINIGPLKLNSAPQIIPLGTTSLAVQTQTYSGLQSAFIHDGDTRFFDIAEADWQNGSDTLEKQFFTLVCTPSQVGTFFVEVDIVQDVDPKRTILTVNMTVTE